MSGLPTPPRLGPRVPLPPPPRENAPVEGEGLVPGDMLEGRYQVEERIGEGGVGFVYRAMQIKLHRRVAVKLLQRDMVGDEELRPRFEREAVTLAALSHPNIVSLQDYGMVRGQPFLVMELLEGSTLRELIDREKGFTPSRALSLARQLLHGLSYAHGRGIVHRDLKPANLLVQSLPTTEHLKVLDFGLVKLLPGSFLDQGVQLSRVGFTFGTPAYMSPEHATGGFVDERSDLYSVGILLFEMLTGKKPFDGELHEIIRHHLSSPVPRLFDVRPELQGREDLQQIVDTCLAKTRDDRVASALALLSMVEAAEARTLELEARERNVSGREGGTSLVPSPPTESFSATPSVISELKSLGSGYRRLALACVYWLRAQMVPWLQQQTARTRRSLKEVSSVAEAKAKQGFAEAEKRAQRGFAEAEKWAKKGWAEGGPKLREARALLLRTVEQAKGRLRPSLRPPAASASSLEDGVNGAGGAHSTAPQPPASPLVGDEATLVGDEVTLDAQGDAQAEGARRETRE